MNSTQTPGFRHRTSRVTLHKAAALLVLVSSLRTAPVAAGEIRESAERHAAALSAQSGTASMAPAVNPHRKAALILGGVGAATLAIGLLRNVPKECTNVAFTAYCGIGSDTKLVVAGLAALGAGGAMYLVGEGKKSIGVGFVPQGIAVQKRIQF